MIDETFDAAEEIRPPTVEEIIEAEVGITIEKFQTEHAITYKALKARIGDPLAFVIDHLERDEAYQALLAQTDEEVDIANILKIVVPMILKVAMSAFGLV